MILYEHWKTLAFAFSVSAILGGGLNSAHADSCETVDLASNGRFPAIRDQGNDGWCYAYTAADLLTYRYGGDFSPVDLAVNYLHYASIRHKNFPKNISEEVEDQIRRSDGDNYASLSSIAGNASFALLATSYYGACDDSEDIHEFNHEATAPGGFTATLAQLQNAEIILRNPRGDANSIEWAKDTIRDFFPSVTDAQIDSLVSNSSRTSNPEMTFIDSLLSSSCKHFLKPAGMSIGDMFIGRDFSGSLRSLQSGLMKELDQALDKKIPVGMGYSYHLDNLKKSGLGFQNHYSIVVGRQYDEQAKECVYVVRNSYGSDCSRAGYDSRLKCDDYGNVLVPASVISKNLYELTFIKN